MLGSGKARAVLRGGKESIAFRNCEEAERPTKQSSRRSNPLGSSGAFHAGGSAPGLSNTAKSYKTNPCLTRICH